MENLDTTTTTTAAPATVSRNTVALAVSTAVVVAGALGFTAGWRVHGSNSTASSATTAVHGILTLPDGGYDSVGTTCSGSGGYNDITAGVAVTIGDQTGKTLAVTSLKPGAFGGGGCQFAFSATVAAATTYTVTISHRGTQTFTPADVASGFNMTMNAG